MLDIHNFKKLRCLFVDEAFLGLLSVESRLPKSLEELEVYHGNPVSLSSLESHGLLGLAFLLHHMGSTRNEGNVKRVSMPLLRRIRVVSLDPLRETDDEELEELPVAIEVSRYLGPGVRLTYLLWHLLQLAIKVDVGLSFFLHRENRCRYKEEDYIEED